MERHEVLAMMTTLKLAGMRTAYDDILADGLKRRHRVQQIIGALLKAEIADKTARSIKYQMASARLPAAKELAEFDFAASPVNEPLIRGRLLRSQAQHRAGRRHRHRQDPSRRRHRAVLHPQGRARPLLQRRRPGQSPRGRTPQAARMASFKSVNTTLGNIKSAITGTYRKLGPDHPGRYLASFAWRYNPRYQLQTMIPRFVHSAARTQPMPYRLLIAG